MSYVRVIFGFNWAGGSYQVGEMYDVLQSQELHELIVAGLVTVVPYPEAGNTVTVLPDTVVEEPVATVTAEDQDTAWPTTTP